MPLGKGLNSLIPPTKSRRIFHRETGDSRDQEKVWQIPLSEIVPNAEQPRRTFSHAELEDLIASGKVNKRTALAMVDRFFPTTSETSC